MKLPRDLSANELIKALAVYDYTVERQKGSHVRLTTVLNGQHHITIPNHDSLKIGTLAAIINDVATHFGKTKDEMLAELFTK